MPNTSGIGSAYIFLTITDVFHINVIKCKKAIRGEDVDDYDGDVDNLMLLLRRMMTRRTMSEFLFIFDSFLEI